MLSSGSVIHTLWTTNVYYVQVNNIPGLAWWACLEAKMPVLTNWKCRMFMCSYTFTQRYIWVFMRYSVAGMTGIYMYERSALDGASCPSTGTGRVLNLCPVPVRTCNPNVLTKITTVNVNNTHLTTDFCFNIQYFAYWWFYTVERWGMDRFLIHMLHTIFSDHHANTFTWLTIRPVVVLNLPQITD